MREEPAALLVLNVGANFPELVGIREGIQIIILSLEVHSHQNQDFTGDIERLRVALTRDYHREGDRQVEGIVGGLVLHKKRPPLWCQFLQLAVCTQGVQQLSALRLEGCLQEEIHEPNEVWIFPKVSFKHLVDEHLDHEEVVSSEETHVRLAIPAWESTSSHRAIHHVVRHHESGLQHLHCPTQYCKSVQVSVSRSFAFAFHQFDSSRDDYKSTIHFSTQGVVLKGPIDPVHLLVWQLIHLRQLLANLIQNTLAHLFQRTLWI
mmetsp:Transcript_25710/g.55883  ORF Transcript_25710/g.55883 Transcript_25710/m.55883 type:complete len:263 (-) Transcript_25710:787-1575(-)